MTEQSARAISSAELVHVIVRACTVCGHTRNQNQPCEGCGNPAPPEVTPLGKVSATYRNPIRRAWWSLVGQPLSKRRIERANRRTQQLADRH